MDFKFDLPSIREVFPILQLDTHERTILEGSGCRLCHRCLLSDIHVDRQAEGLKLARNNLSQSQYPPAPNILSSSGSSAPPCGQTTGCLHHDLSEVSLVDTSSQVGLPKTLREGPTSLCFLCRTTWTPPNSKAKRRQLNPKARPYDRCYNTVTTHARSSKGRGYLPLRVRSNEVGVFDAQERPPPLASHSSPHTRSIPVDSRREQQGYALTGSPRQFPVTSSAKESSPARMAPPFIDCTTITQPRLHGSRESFDLEALAQTSSMISIGCKGADPSIKAHPPPSAKVPAVFTNLSDLAAHFSIPSKFPPPPDLKARGAYAVREDTCHII
ncbi:hypothetical protein NMY22_g7398 [Coprinellus aureogranulatus]|nr:hypothetical protein NMY22_g7398 [Coprinellus aureogranulatus]